MVASRARLASVVRWYSQQHTAVPLHLIRQLSPEFTPPLIENGAVQAGLLLHHLAWLFAVALGRLGHVPYLQILNAYERVVLADRRCGFVQEVFAGVSDAGVNLLDFGFRLFPVTAELHLTAHAPLVTCKALLVHLKAVEWRNIALIAHGGEPRNADIDADSACCRGQWLFDFAYD